MKYLFAIALACPSCNFPPVKYRQGQNVRVLSGIHTGSIFIIQSYELDNGCADGINYKGELWSKELAVICQEDLIADATSLDQMKCDPYHRHKCLITKTKKA